MDYGLTLVASTALAKLPLEIEGTTALSRGSYPILTERPCFWRVKDEVLKKSKVVDNAGKASY